MKATELMTEAASLPLEERAQLVDALLEALNPADEVNTAAWLVVARGRLEDVESDRVTTVSGDEVFERIGERLEGGSI